MTKPRNRGTHKGRRESGYFTLIPHAVQDSANWLACSGSAIKLGCELARQYNGRNNGDLCAAWSMMKRRRWKSPTTLKNALNELRHYGLIVMTRQGGLNVASLYALTWQAIDDCSGKLDCASTVTPPGEWKHDRSEPFKRPRKAKKKQNASTETVAARYGIRTSASKKAA